MDGLWALCAMLLMICGGCGVATCFELPMDKRDFSASVTLAYSVATLIGGIIWACWIIIKELR